MEPGASSFLCKGDEKLSDYESNIKINVDDSELSDAEKRINNLKDKKVDVGFKVDNSGISKTSDGLKQVEQSAKGSGKAVDGLGQSMGNVSKNTLAAVASYKVFNATIKQLKDAVSEVEALNGALTKVHMTMQDISNADLGSLKSQILDMSNELSTYVDTVSDAAEIYANANESISTIMQKAEPTVLLASATKKSASETADTIQGILNQFKMTDDAAMGVVDTLEGLSAEMNMDFAKGIQNVSEAVKVSGSVIDSAGMSFERYASIVSATAESTRLSGSVLGNAFKTISSRIGRSKDGETTNAEKANSEKALNSIGISIRDTTTGDIQDLDITLESLSKVWGDLNRSQQNYIAEQSAGVRQISIFKNMMDNYSRAMELEEKALNSSGTAMKVNETRAESIDGKMQKLSSTMSKMYNDAVSEDVIMNVLDLANGIAQVADKLGLLQGAFAALGTVGIAKGIGLISSNWEKLLSVFKSPVTKLSAGVGIATSVAIKGFELLDDKFTLTFATAQKHMEESASAYESNYSELQSINSELETTSSRIAELKSQGTLTIAEEAELAKLERQNSLLEAQQKLKQSATDASQKQAATDAATSINFKSEKSTQTRTDKNGMDMEVSIDRKEYIREQVALMEEAQRQIDQATEKINSGDKSKKWEEQLKTASDNLNTYKENATNTLSDLNSEAENLYDESTGNVIKGYEGLVNEIDSLNNLVNNFDLSGIEKNQAAIESFFDDTSGTNFLKDELIEVAKSGEITEDTLTRMGLSLEGLGLSGKDGLSALNKYFKELASSADEANSSVKEFDGSLESITNASESENQDTNWNTVSELFDKAKELDTNKKWGTDDFQSMAQFIAPESAQITTKNTDLKAADYKDLWDKYKSNFEKYFDTDNPLQSAINAQDKLLKSGLGSMDSSGIIKWSDSFKSSADAAKAWGISVEAAEVAMHNLESYGAEFDGITFNAEELENYKSSLDGIRDIYDQMDEGSDKDRLGKLLQGWDEEYAKYEQDISTLNKDQVVKIKFEYDLASIQSQIDEIQELINSGDNTVQNNAKLIAGNQKYITTAEQGLGFDVEGIKVPVEYEANENTIEALKSQLKRATSEDDKLKIQAEIQNLQELQKDLLNAFSDAHPEINADSSMDDINDAWDDFVKSTERQELIANITANDEDAKETIAKLLGIDVEDITVDIEANDNASDIINKVSQEEIEDKIVKLIGEDDATPYINLWNTMSADPKFAELSADDQATLVLETYNSLSIDDKNSLISQTGGEATKGVADAVSASINAIPKSKQSTITITTIKKTITQGGTVKNSNGGIIAGGAAQVSGTMLSPAHASGTAYNVLNTKPISSAYAGGRVSLDRNERALVNEEYINGHSESIIRDGVWRLIPGGMHLENLKKGDIVLNARQTDDLLRSGRTNSHARAYASGSLLAPAYGSGMLSLGGSYGNSYGSTTTASTPSSTQATQANTDATKENTEAQKETIDWIETLVDTQKSENERLSNAIENFEMHFNQNSAIDAYIKDSQAYMNTLRNAQNAYMSKANALGLDGTYVHKIWSGELSIEDITDEDLADKIKKYQDWYNQAKDLGDQLTEINTKIRESKINKLDNIKDDYDNLVDYAKSIADYNEAINDLYEARNLVGLEDPMMQVVNQQNAIRQALLNEEKELNNQLNALVTDGTIAEYSDTWLKWKKEINGVSQEILECDKTLEELKETIREIRFNDFEKSLDALEFTSDMASSIRELMSEEGIYDDDAKITESGIAQLGLMGTELVSAKQKVANYNTAIEALAKDLENGNITQAQYNEQLQEYQKNQMDAIKSAKSAKDAILDLVKNGIEKETEAMDKLISKRKEDLSKQKEYYDFQKTMTDKSKEINKVRAQLASLEGDNSLEALSKRRKLESQLLELQDEYNENLRDREYDVVSDAYDKTLEDFKDNQDETLKELETNLDAQNKAIADALEIAKENYSGVYNQLQILADEYGFTLTDTIVKPWEDAISAIDQYQQSVGKLQGNISIDTSKIQGESPSGEQTIPTNNEASNQNLSKSANGTWIKQNGRWWYQHDDGSYTTNGWENIDGKWYKFDNNGWMQTGWQTDGKDENGNTKWYYLNSNGAMQSGWQKVNGKWYYLDSSGLMQTGWKNVNGMWYLLDQSGAMQTGWQKVDGKWYYLNSNGSMAVSQWIDDKYYVDHTGVMATNGYIKSKSGNQYYWVNDKGVYEPRWTTDHPDLEKYQLFYSSGAYRTKRGYGYVDDKDKKLYPGSELVLESNGVMTDYGILRPLTGRETIFNEEQRKALWEMSLGKMPVGYEQTSPLDNMKVNFSKNDNQEVNIHYDNLIGNIEYVDKNALPDLQTILKKSFDYNVKELKKYSKR